MDRIREKLTFNLENVQQNVRDAQAEYDRERAASVDAEEAMSQQDLTECRNEAVVPRRDAARKLEQLRANITDSKGGLDRNFVDEQLKQIRVHENEVLDGLTKVFPKPVQDRVGREFRAWLAAQDRYITNRNREIIEAHKSAESEWTKMREAKAEKERG